MVNWSDIEAKNKLNWSLAVCINKLRDTPYLKKHKLIGSTCITPMFNWTILCLSSRIYTLIKERHAKSFDKD